MRRTIQPPRPAPRKARARAAARPQGVPTHWLVGGLVAAGLALALAPRPASAQDLPSLGAGGATSADPCQANYNRLTLRIDPGKTGVPFLIEPFTSVGEWPDELLELYQRCQPYLESPPQLITWSGRGPGITPVGDLGGSNAGGPVERPGLPAGRPNTNAGR